MKSLLFVGLGLAGGAWAGTEVDGLSLPWKSVRVSSPVQDIVAEVKVEEGMTVTKDQVLARCRRCGRQGAARSVGRHEG